MLWAILAVSIAITIASFVMDRPGAVESNWQRALLVVFVGSILTAIGTVGALIYRYLA